MLDLKDTLLVISSSSPHNESRGFYILLLPWAERTEQGDLFTPCHSPLHLSHRFLVSVLHSSVTYFPMDGDGDCEAGGEWVWVSRLPEAEAAAAAAGWPVPSAEEARPLKVVFASPAKYFTDAAPIGNGRLGAMIWGGVASERLQLNRN